MPIKSDFYRIVSRSAIACLTVMTFSSAITPAAKAQDTIRFSPVTRLQTIPERFDEVYFRRDPDYFANRTLIRQLLFLTGPFSENEIANDAQGLSDLYYETMSRQLNNFPIVRTPDLPNPFNESLLTLPKLANSPPLLVEQPPFVSPPIVAPPVTRPQPDSPVPALW
ncbi:hypothetical protein [Pantanalinema sp. GBBB05]|uniref:hypothetical protein n=1 Tax=Pantanalinema sp. GBBB05 TaxID=2604139 RepID=UPI001E1520D3|nr:hypothetical protein [Pantanalinema sp. GBBB05]